MANSYQCPQCGASNSVKISDSEYHCPYCDSNFTAGMTKQEMIASILAKASGVHHNPQSQKLNQQQLDAMRAQMAATAADVKKKGCSIAIVILVIVLGIIGVVIYNVNKAVNTISASIPDLAKSLSINKFQGFAGSKGAVLWILFEDDERANGDSTQYILKIIDPKSNKTLQSLNFIPELSDKDAFDANKLIGDFHSFGDTCWIVSETNGLVARNIYSGKIIVDANSLALLYPKLKGGIAKASFQNYNNTFELTTNDGFEYIFHPNSKKLYTKEEWEKATRGKSVVRNFFILTDTKRPQLFATSEKTTPLATSSKTFSSQLEDFNEHSNLDRFNDDIETISILQKDVPLFNGTIVYSNDSFAVIVYQNSIAKTSGIHIEKIGIHGKIYWDISGKEIKQVGDQYVQNKYAVDYSISPKEMVLYYFATDREAMGIDLNTGKISWTYSTAPTKK